MAWIESHQSLGRHPKTRKAGRLLGVSRPAVVGHLHYLWWWCLDFAQDGDLGQYDDDEIAEAAEWDEDPATFIAALTEAGFLTADRLVHDWDDYAGKLIEQRKANAEKQKRWRERNKPDTSPAHNDPVTVTSPLRNGATVPNRTVPNPTEPNQTVETPPLPPTPPPPTPLRPVAAPPDRPAQDPPGFAAFWQAWPKKEAKAEALTRWKKIRPDPDTIQAILDAIPQQQAAKDWPRENWRYCPNPATWLNQRRWEDEMPDPLPKERTLVGKDRERLDVGTRVLEARRQRERNGFDGVVDQAGGALSHDAHGNGTRRLSR